MVQAKKIVAFRLVASEGERMAGISDPVHRLDLNQRRSAGACLPSWERHASVWGDERELLSHDGMTKCNPGMRF